jgi:copper chaperone NosL
MLLLAGALMLASLSYPMWSIYLWSFSYPNGIGMSVYQNKPGDPVDVDQLDGGVDELEVLNHFIGMKPITKDLLIFKILPKATVLMGVLFIVAAFWRKRKFLYGVAGAGILLGMYGMGSFFYYMYQYGHDLDPNAAITIEPFMPGIIGEKNLAQFTSWSQFENGTFFLILSTMLVLIVAGAEWWMARKQQHEKKA